jgi:high-affinity nickel-transport protein
MTATPIPPPLLVAIGFALGMRHAADPDHVVAVTALTARTPRILSAAWLGICWGIGHTLTLFAVGVGILVFGWIVPPRVGLALEFAAALALVAVGLLNVGRAASGEDAGFGVGRPAAGRAFAVGLVHGLAGSAAVALLVLAAVRDVRWGCVYLAMFGLGTLAGMTLVTTGMALPLIAARQRWSGASRALRLGTGALSLGFGIWLAWQTGWRDGLFAALGR